MKHPLLISSMVLALAMPVSAVAKDTFTVVPASGDNLVFDATSGTSITFKGRTMTITTADGSTPILLDDVSEITFQLEAASDHDITAELAEGLVLTVKGRKVTATAAADTHVVLEAFTTAGIMAARAAAPGSAEIDFTDMPAGIYIIRCADKAIKFTNR